MAEALCLDREHHPDDIDTDIALAENHIFICTALYW